METKEPQHYWAIAKEYIIEKDKELREEGKYYIDKQYAYKCVKFGSLIKLTSGELAGVNFQFMDFQLKAVIDIFGTKHLKGKFKGLRRYQRALFFGAKKLGKTEFGSLLTMIYFFLDDEKSKECYSIASEIQQAKILHKAFITMLKQEDDLMESVHITKQPPKVTKEDGAFTDEYEALSSTADTKDGKRPSLLLIDEPHAYPNKELYQIMSDGLAGRTQPLEIFMSTAGYNLQGFFYLQIYNYAKKIKNGTIKDDTFYQVMFEPDEEDLEDDNFWKDPKVWAKSNPNLGISPTFSYMEGKVKQAEQSEESLISFKTKHLNVFCDKADIWIKHSVWTANQTPINEDDLIGKECYGGLDLATNTDLAALVLIFPKTAKDGSRAYDVVTRFWIPKDNMRERVRRDRVPYLDWYKKGIITATDGNIIDSVYIEKEISDVLKKFNVHSIAYDRHNSTDLIRRLQENGIDKMIEFPQTAPKFNPAVCELEILAYKGNLNHGNNEALNWQCSNVVMLRDSNGNRKMDKKISSEKIDGMVSLAMAVAVALVFTEQEEASIYEERGLRDLSS